MDAKSSSQTKGEIATEVSVVLESFDVLARLLDRTLENRERAQLLVQTADSKGRFRVWSANIGAHKVGRSSLDHRLREAPYLRVVVLKSLRRIQDLLSDAKDVSIEPQLSDDASTSDSNSIADSDEFDESEELSDISKEVAEVVKSLYRLSMSIRTPSGNRRYIKSSSIDTSYFEANDIQHIQHMFPKAAAFLCDRLGRAISRRRQYFRYREAHSAKLAQHIDNDEDKSYLSDTSATELSGSRVINTVIPTPGRKTVDAFDTKSMVSDTSYATSADGADRSRWPAMPAEAVDGEPFICPFCHLPIEVSITRDWRKHIVQDLEPYLCTFENCITSTEMYQSRGQWFQHEIQVHRQSWICDGHCEESFRSEEDFLKHTSQYSSNDLNDAQKAALLNTCARPAAKESINACPLCKDNIEGISKLQKHLGQHLLDLSRFALPIIEGDSGDDVSFTSSEDPTTDVLAHRNTIENSDVENSVVIAKGGSNEADLELEEVFRGPVEDGIASAENAVSYANIRNKAIC